MHKASFCLQAEKSVRLNNYVLSYPTLHFCGVQRHQLAVQNVHHNIFHNRVFLNKLIVKSKLL